MFYPVSIHYGSVYHNNANVVLSYNQLLDGFTSLATVLSTGSCGRLSKIFVICLPNLSSKGEFP